MPTGSTGLAILVARPAPLRHRRSSPYVPSRLDEGHGLSLAAVDAAIAAGATVIVTVDCGTSSRDEIADAERRGHRRPRHRPPPRPGRSCRRPLAIVNPHRADSAYPDRRLAGSGVAFKVAQLLLRSIRRTRRPPWTLADLATIGTVADVAPIVGENRAIARLGLERLRHGPRPGLAALLDVARGSPRRTSTWTRIAFALAPRLNAAGRVGEALEAAPPAPGRGRRRGRPPMPTRSRPPTRPAAT